MSAEAVGVARNEGEANALARGGVRSNYLDPLLHLENTARAEVEETSEASIPPWQSLDWNGGTARRPVMEWRTSAGSKT